MSSFLHMSYWKLNRSRDGSLVPYTMSTWSNMAPVFLHVGDGRPQRRQPQSSGDQQDVLAVHALHGEAGAEGAADADAHARAPPGRGRS